MRTLTVLLAAAVLAAGCRVPQGPEYSVYDEVIPEVLDEEGFTVQRVDRGSFVGHTPVSMGAWEKERVRVEVRMEINPDGAFEPQVHAVRQMEDADVRTQSVSQRRYHWISYTRLPQLEVALLARIHERFLTRRDGDAPPAEDGEPDAKPAEGAPAPADGGPAAPADGGADSEVPEPAPTFPIGLPNEA